jgi:hypothetical protein
VFSCEYAAMDPCMLHASQCTMLHASQCKAQGGIQAQCARQIESDWREVDRILEGDTICPAREVGWQGLRLPLAQVD